MMLRKSREPLISGSVSRVNASMSRRRPGTAAERSLVGPRAERIAERRCGYAWISQVLWALGTCL